MRASSLLMRVPVRAKSLGTCTLVTGIGWWACATLWACWIGSTRGTATAAAAATTRVERRAMKCMTSSSKMG